MSNLRVNHSCIFTSIDLLSEEEMALIISYRQNSLKVVVLPYFALQIEVENTNSKSVLKYFFQFTIDHSTSPTLDDLNNGFKLV